METKENKPKIGKFTCFVDVDTDVSPEALKRATPHIHRGVQFKEEDRDAIQRLFSHCPIPTDFEENGDWLFETMTDGKYHYVIVSDKDVKEKYKGFDASGVLGCGPGSERFAVPTKDQVMECMKGSKSEAEWNENCDKVKKAHGGQYPDYWYETFIQSGLINEILGPGSDEIKIKKG
jgi:hypothetical protein